MSVVVSAETAAQIESAGVLSLLSDGDLTTWQDRLLAWRALGELADLAMHKEVALARAADSSVAWADVGRVLRISRQAAWERFARG